MLGRLTVGRKMRPQACCTATCGATPAPTVWSPSRSCPEAPAVTFFRHLHDPAFHVLMCDLLRRRDYARFIFCLIRNVGWALLSHLTFRRGEHRWQNLPLPCASWCSSPV